MIAWCVGTCATCLKTEVRFGHAGAQARGRGPGSRRARRLPKGPTRTSTPWRSWRPEQGGGRADERKVLLVRPPRGIVQDLGEITWLVPPRMLVDASGIYEAVQERKAGRASAAPDEPRPRTKAKLCQREPWSRRAAGARGMGTSCALRHAGGMRTFELKCMCMHDGDRWRR